MASEYTEQDRANEGCCWTWQRDQCPGAGCRCVCHMSGEPVRTTYFDLVREIEGYRQRSRDEDTARIRLNHARIEAEENVARLTALLAERDAEIVRLVDAGQAYIDAYDAALKAPLQYAQAEEYCHAQRYNLRAALAARGGPAPDGVHS